MQDEIEALAETIKEKNEQIAESDVALQDLLSQKS